MIRGILIPVITPFDDQQRVDEPILRQIVDFYVGTGVQGLFVLGSSGQGPVMSTEERKRTAEAAVEQAGGRTPVVVHVGAADTQVTVELAEHAAAQGANAVAVVPPFYYSDHTEFEIIAHYKAVGEATPLPVFIYENPRYAGISIKPDLAVRMKEAIPSIKGIKVAYGLGSMLDYVRLLPDVAVFTGNADLFGLAPFGLAGMINPPTSFAPELCVALWDALESRDYERAVVLQEQVNTTWRLVRDAIQRYGRSTVAETYRMRGFAVQRFPKWDTKPMPDEAREQLRRELEEAGALPQPSPVR